MTMMSNALEVAILNEVLRNTGYTPVATVYAALFGTTGSVALLEANTLTGEISGNGYARTAIVFDAAASPGGTCANQLCTFPVCTPAAWGTVRFMAIMDAASGAGTLGVLVYCQLTSDVVTNINDQLKFAAGDLIVTLG
jgi:hypothetical protein